ncbi:MAG: N-acetylmuramoyl-L-alanine amidase-like domain-containing protein, partial [Gammaproteobacteria bacterium]
MRAPKTLCIVLMLFADFAETAAVEGAWTDPVIDRILYQARNIADPGNRIDVISAQFLNTPYSPNTLIGSPTLPEQLTVRLDAVDCLTYLEYVEALRRSRSSAAFLENLKKVRYRDGKVEYGKRKHFFSDWTGQGAAFIDDVTAKVGLAASIDVKKRLNEPSPTPIVPGIPVAERVVRFIPSYKFDAKILSRLKHGDYIGIYTDRDGLDVDHVGIVIKNGSKIYIRHADAFAPNKKVVD